MFVLIFGHFHLHYPLPLSVSPPETFHLPTAPPTLMYYMFLYFYPLRLAMVSCMSMNVGLFVGTKIANTGYNSELKDIPSLRTP